MTIDKITELGAFDYGISRNVAYRICNGEVQYAPANILMKEWCRSDIFYDKDEPQNKKLRMWVAKRLIALHGITEGAVKSDDQITELGAFYYGNSDAVKYRVCNGEVQFSTVDSRKREEWWRSGIFYGPEDQEAKELRTWVAKRLMELHGIDDGAVPSAEEVSAVALLRKDNTALKSKVRHAKQQLAEIALELDELTDKISNLL